MDYGNIDEILEILRIIRHNYDFFASEPCEAIPQEYRLNVLETNNLLLKLTKCRCNELISELTTNFLQAAEKKYFFIIYGTKLREAHNHLLYIMSRLSTNHNAGFIFLVRALQFIVDKALETIQSYQNAAQIADIPIEKNFGMHFNRRPCVPSEPEKITPLMIAAGLIPEQTQPATLKYCFYGLGVPTSDPVITWLKTAAELSYFVETYFTASDAKNKWKIASDIFRDTQNVSFKQKTLKQRLYNYTSKVKLSSFSIIDTLFLPILQNPDK